MKSTLYSEVNIVIESQLPCIIIDINNYSKSTLKRELLFNLSDFTVQSIKRRPR